MFFGIRLALTGTLALSAALFTMSEVMAQSPKDADNQETIPIPDIDKCVEIRPIEGGPPVLDCTRAKAGPISFPPVIVGPMYANEDGFTLALVDERSPRGTVYRVTVTDQEMGDETVTDWSASRCRRFGGLRRSAWYRLEVVARNVSGFETEPVVRWMYYPGSNTQNRTPADDPWLVDRIDDVVTVYNLTERARTMILNIPIAVYRNEPGFAGYGGPNYGILVGHASHPWTLSHELMHAFWEHWDGFPLPCDKMNIYTFRRDLAQFILMFRAYDRTHQPNPWEDWRLYYNNLTAEFSNYSGSEGETAWELLAEVLRDGGHFRADIWNLMYHVADTDPPMLIRGRVHLMPPLLRRYFEGYIHPVQEAEPTTWRDELDLYLSLTRKDLRLMDFASRYHHRLSAHSNVDHIGEPGESLMSLPEPFRVHVRGADRQALVDFVNTLEDISCNTDCEELWTAAPGFWSGYTYENLIRSLLYTDEIGIDTGIELEESNWNAVRQALDVLPACDETSADDARELISSLSGITEIQRAALLQVLVERERHYWLCDAFGGNSRQEARGIEDERYSQYSLRSRVDILESEVTCGSTALYERPPLDLSKGPCHP